jgi:hypothetical protein
MKYAQSLVLGPSTLVHNTVLSAGVVRPWPLDLMPRLPPIALLLVLEMPPRLVEVGAASLFTN